MNHQHSSSHGAEHDDPHNHKHTVHPERLQSSDRFFEPLDRQIVQWLELAPGSRVLDAGCGSGGITRLMAEAVGPEGHVVGLDANPDLLAHDRAAVAGTELAERISYQEGDITNLPFEDGAFDLVWCSRVIHGLPDQLAGVRELRRVVRPGGRVVVREGGFGTRFLPFDLGVGEAGLEARLQAAQTSWFARWRASLLDAVAYPFGWGQMLKEAGLNQVAPKSFLHEFTAPLETYQKEYLEGNLGRELKDNEHPLLSAQDTQTLTQLLDKTGPHYVFNRDDLHVIMSETIFAGYA